LLLFRGLVMWIRRLLRGIAGIRRLLRQTAGDQVAAVEPLTFEDKVRFACWRAVGLVVGARPVAFRHAGTAENGKYVIGIRARTRVRLLGGEFAGFTVDNSLNGSLRDFMLFPGDVKIVLVNNTFCWGTECTCEVLRCANRRWWKPEKQGHHTCLLFHLRPDCSPCERQQAHCLGRRPRAVYVDDDHLPGVKIAGSSGFFFVCEVRNPGDLCEKLADPEEDSPEDLQILQNSRDRAKGHLYRAWDIIGGEGAGGSSSRFSAFQLAAKIEHFFTEFGLFYLAYLQVRERTWNEKNALAAFVLVTLGVLNTLLNASLPNTIEHFTTSDAWYWRFTDREVASPAASATGGRAKVRMSFEGHVDILRRDQSKAIVLLLPRLLYSLGVLVLQQPLPGKSVRLSVCRRDQETGRRYTASFHFTVQGVTSRYLTLITNATAAGYWFLCLVLVTLWSTVVCKPCLPSTGPRRLFPPVVLSLSLGALVIYFHLKQAFPIFPQAIPWYVPHVILLFLALLVHVAVFVIKPIFFQVGVMHSTISVLFYTVWRLIRPFATLLYHVLSNPKEALKNARHIAQRLWDNAITIYLQLLLITCFALGVGTLLCTYTLFWPSAAGNPL